jgi:hypothetical protein
VGRAGLCRGLGGGRGRSGMLGRRSGVGEGARWLTLLAFLLFGVYGVCNYGGTTSPVSMARRPQYNMLITISMGAATRAM